MGGARSFEFIERLLVTNDHGHGALFINACAQNYRAVLKYSMLLVGVGFGLAAHASLDAEV